MEQATQLISGIPDGITRDDVETAIADFDNGVDHGEHGGLEIRS